MLPLPFITMSAKSLLLALLMTPLSDILKLLKIKLLCTKCSVAPDSAMNSIR